MAELVFLSGTGRVVLDGMTTPIGTVEYKIVVDGGSDPRSARGTIWAHPSVIDDILLAAGATLFRGDTGEPVRIICQSHNADGSGEITVSGSPGTLP